MIRKDASFWTAFATFVAVVAAIVIAYVQVREQRDEAKVQHLVDETGRFDQEPLLTSRRVLAAKRIDKVHETLRPLDLNNEPTEMWDVLNACDHIGFLTKRGYLDVTDVWNEMGYWLMNVYADAQPVVEANRKKSPATMANCSWLIDQMRPIEANRDAGDDNSPTPEDLYGFYAGEVDALPGKLVAHRASK